MPRVVKLSRARRRRAASMLVVAVAGFAAAALVGIAVARTVALEVAKNAKVTNQMGVTEREAVVVNSGGFALYDLTGDSKRHPECSEANGCWKLWPPATVSSGQKPSAAPGVKGKLGVWHRNGLFQVVLAGHPLYRFAPDNQRHAATGEGIHGFGGTWHVLKRHESPPGTTSTMTNAPSITTTTTSAGTPCLYPPCY